MGAAVVAVVVAAAAAVVAAAAAVTVVLPLTQQLQEVARKRHLVAFVYSPVCLLRQKTQGQRKQKPITKKRQKLKEKKLQLSRIKMRHTLLILLELKRIKEKIRANKGKKRK